MVVQVGTKRFRAECKGEPLIKKPGGHEYPKLRGALGQVMTVVQVDVHDVLAVAVPRTLKSGVLAERWREAPLVVRSEVLIVLVGRDGEVEGVELGLTRSASEEAFVDRGRRAGCVAAD